MISTVVDFSQDFADGSKAVIDASNWDWVVVQVVNPSGTINFLASNDSGAITGVSDGNSISATNFTAAQATNIATGTAVTSTAAAGLFRFAVVGRYIQISGNGGTETVDKLLVYLTKIS